ncbi:ATP-binding protein [Candidatus Bipolaricaulota bacterium]|nr:ATP-binding protein [Candidatus Bipolaricaulota bacterium]
MIMAPRRFGKTALLQRVCAEISNDMLAPYVNCLPLHRAEIFHDRIVEAVLDAFEARHGKGRKLLATWKDVIRRPIISALERLEEVGGSVQNVGGIRLKFRTREADEDELLRAALDFPERFAEETGESVLLALDELQALTALGERIFPLFKNAMDTQRRVAYLFSGSSLTLLCDVFAQEGRSPLYQMVGRAFLEELDSTAVATFVKRRLRSADGARIEPPALDRYIERVGGIPYYVQKLGLLLEHRLHLQGGNSVGENDVDGAFERLLDELDLDFQERWTTRFSDQQRAILLALCSEPARSSQIAERAGVPAENLTYNLKKLVGTMILRKESNKYRITDRVFAAWLARLLGQ